MHSLNFVFCLDRQDPDNLPLIVVDFMNLIYCVTISKADAICGGRPRNAMQSFKKALNKLRSLGCRLVFFSDLNTPASKAEKWKKRHEYHFKVYTKFYNSITRNKPIEKILNKYRSIKLPNSGFYDMENLARKYGEFHYSVKRENDQELVRYANSHNALAVISNDTDFLIYDGPWRIWYFEKSELMRLIATEYDKNGLLKALEKNIFSIIGAELKYHSNGILRFYYRSGATETIGTIVFRRKYFRYLRNKMGHFQMDHVIF